jgi:hypothetical protein
MSPRNPNGPRGWVIPFFWSMTFLALVLIAGFVYTVWVR